MLKTFEYRLYPTKRQERLLSEQLEELRWLWNTLLAERKIAWEERQEAVSYYDQQNALPTMKTSLRPPLAQVHSLVVQDAVRRLQKAMDAFFRRLKAERTQDTHASGARDAMIRSPTLGGTTASSSARVANGSFSPRSGT